MVTAGAQGPAAASVPSPAQEIWRAEVLPEKKKKKKEKSPGQNNQASWRAFILYYCTWEMKGSSKLRPQFIVDILALRGVKENSARNTASRILLGGC